MAISTNNVVTARFAGAMYNVALDYSTNQQVQTAVATPGSMDPFLNQLYLRDFSNQAGDVVATTIATNLGLTGDALDAAIVYLTGWINGTALNERGATIGQILNNFAQMTADPTFGAFATAWNASVDNAVAYSQNSSSTAAVAFNNVPVAPVGSFTLTNGTDIATANIFTAGLVYTPGGDDRINSLQDEDQLTGTGTAPTLTATLGNANDNGGPVITPKLTGISIINTAFTGSGGGTGAVTTLDLQDATGQTEVNVTRVSQAVNLAEVGNLMTPAATLSLSNTNSNQAGIVEFSYSANVLRGLNTGTLALNNVQVGTLNIGQNTSGVGPAAFGVGINGFENLTLTSSGGAANTVGNFNLPMDTGTSGKIVITGDQDLTLGAPSSVINAASATVESTLYNSGVLQTGGRLSAIDASGFTKNLTLNIQAGLLSTGKADTSGVAQNVTITGGSGNDTFILGDIVQAGDSLTGGTGTDTLIVNSGGTVNSQSSILTGFENVQVRAALGGAVTVDFDKLPDTLLTLVRNEGAVPPVVVGAATVPIARALVTNLNNLTAVEAAALNTQHSNTFSNGIAQNTINATLKTAAGTNDLVSMTISEGLNTDPRFNFVLGTQNAAGATGNVESITLVDADTESNTVALASVAQHTGTITLTTGLAGTFLNLDTTVAGNGGMYQYATNGSPNAGSGDANSSNAGPTVGRIADQSLTAGQIKLVAATINAAAEVSDVVVRVSTNGLSVVGAQNITMGAGNDTVIFDNVPAGAVPDTRAGLTISDTVAGGAGNDTLVIDGHNTAITLGASEWTNVSGFETIRVVGDGAAANNAAGAVNSYNLTVTNNLLSTNKDTNGFLNFVADNDLFNNTSRTVAQAAVTTVTNADATVVAVANDAGLSSGGVTLDARSLNAGSKWSFKGNEGPGRSADRLIMADANIDGNAVIDGGAIDNINNNMGIASLNGTSVVGNGVIANLGNADVIEVRNAAVVAQGDLANVKNIGTLSFTNDLSVTQVSTLQLNDTIVDAMVDSFQTSVSRAAVATQTTGGANVEVLMVNAVDNMNVAGATTGLTIQAETLTDRSDLSVTLGRGANTVATGGGQDRVVLLGNYVAGTYAVVENGVNINAQSTPGAVALVSTDNINLGGGTDTLVTYGAINLAGATLTGVEAIVASSALVITAAQFRALTSLTFTGNASHQLRIIGDGGASLDLTKIFLGAAPAGLNGNLVYSTVDAAGVAMVNAPTGAVVDNSTNGDVAVGTVSTAPVNGGGNALTNVVITGAGTFTGTAGVNDNFTTTIANLGLATAITGTAADNETLTITDAGAVAIPATVTNIDNLVLSLGNTVTFAAITSGITRVTGSAAVDNVDLTGLGANGVGTSVDLAAGAGQTLTLGAQAYTGTLQAGAGVTDAMVFVTGSNISGAGVSGFENVTFVGNNTLTVAQYNGFTGTITAAGGADALTFTTAGSITGNAAIETYNLGNGTNVVTLAGATAQTLNGNATAGNDSFLTTIANLANKTIAANVGTDSVTISDALGGAFTLAAAGAAGAALTGVETVTLSAGTNGNTLTMFNGAGTVNLTTVAAQASTVLLGTGGQTLNVSNSTTATVGVTVNTGVDTVNLSNAAASGVQTVTVVAANSNITSFDTISGFRFGTDKLAVAGAQTGGALVSVATADTATLAAAIQAAINANTVNYDALNEAIYINVAAGTAAGVYLAVNAAADTLLGADDVFVKLTGTSGTFTVADLN